MDAVSMHVAARYDIVHKDLFAGKTFHASRDSTILIKLLQFHYLLLKYNVNIYKNHCSCNKIDFKKNSLTVAYCQ